jgi:hypothetical protein
VGNESFRFINQHDVLNLLYRALLETNLQGFGSRKVKDLGLFKRPTFVTTKSERALMVFMKMDNYRVTAVPIVDLNTHKIVGELSNEALSAVRAENFGVLMGSVGHLHDSLAQAHARSQLPLW